MALSHEQKKYYELKDKQSSALMEAEKQSHQASDSTLNRSITVNSNIMYIKGLGDIHIPRVNYEKFERELREDALIKDLRIVLLGDQGDTALETVGSSSTYDTVTTPSQEVDILANSFRKAGQPLINKIDAIIDGNHDLRVKKASSIRPGELLAAKIRKDEVYAENIQVLNYIFKHPKTKENISFNVLVRHGEGTSANPGKKADQNLTSQILKNFDLIIDGHTHKIVYSSTRIKTALNGVKKPKEKEIHAANFGSPQRTANYGEEAGYGAIAPTDGELLRVSLIPENDKDYSFSVDFVNRREIIKQQAQEYIEQLNKKLLSIENRNYKKITDIVNSYKQITHLAGDMLSEVDVENILKSKFSDKEEDKIPTELRLMIWSGMLLGDDDIENEDQIEKAINVAKKLDSSGKIILNGDLIKDINHGNISKKDDASKTFSRIEVLAERLKDVKKQIVGFNYGVQEAGIIKYQGEDLAKLALTNLQMDEKEVYEPYNKTQLLIRKKEIQLEEVRKHNKATLKRSYNTVLHDQNKWEQLEEDVNFKISKAYKQELLDELKLPQDAYIQATYDNLKRLVKTRLRYEGKLLDSSKKRDKKIINAKFPLSEIELRKPQKDLIAKIFCKFLNKNYEDIVVNTQVNTNSVITTKVRKKGGKIMTVNIVGGYSRSTAGRGAQHKKLSANENLQSGADIYYNTSKTGKEYMTKKRSLINVEGKFRNVIKDSYFISSGRFDNSHDRQDQEASSNRIYTIKVGETAKEDLEENRNTRSMYEGALEKYILTCSSVGYNSALLDHEITKSVVTKCIENSAEKVIDEFLDKEKQRKKQQALKKILNNIKKEHKTQLNDKKQQLANTKELENVKG